MKKLLGKLHSLTGFIAGGVICVVCLSGAALVFRQEIDETLNKDKFFVNEDTKGDVLDANQLVMAANQQLTDDQVTSITAFNDTQRNWIVNTTNNPRMPLYINPYTGILVQQDDNGGGNFWGTILRLHRWLTLTPSTGRPIVGYATLLLTVMIITGIVIILPKTRQALKRVFTIHTRRGWKRLLYDLHISAGYYISLSLLALTLTGLTWSFKSYNDSIYILLGAQPPTPRQHTHNTQPVPTVDSTKLLAQQSGTDDRQQQRRDGRTRNGQGRTLRSEEDTTRRQRRGQHPRGEQPDTNAREQIRERRRQLQITTDSITTATDTTDYTAWNTVLLTLKQLNPKHKSISVRNGMATVYQNMTTGNSRANDNYKFDINTGDITEYTPYSEQTRGNKIRGWIYTIHTGTWAGITSKIIAFVTALVGGTLPITGYYMFYNKRRRRRKRKQQHASGGGSSLKQG